MFSNLNYDLGITFGDFNLPPIYTFLGGENISSVICLVQETFSKKFDGFLELEQLIHTSFKPHEFLDCYLQVLNSLKIEKGKINEASLEVLNQILFIEALISLIEKLSGEKIDGLKIRQNVFQSLEHFPVHNKEAYNGLIFEIKDFVGAIHELEILEQSLIQHINNENAENFEKDLSKVFTIGTVKMLFGVCSLDFRRKQLVQAFKLKINKNTKDFKILENEIIENMSDLKIKCLHVKKIALRDHLVEHEFHSLGHFFYQSIRIHTLFEHVANKLYENNTTLKF